MGVFDFIKDVGEKLFGASEANAAPADKIKEELKKHGLDSDKLDITVDGDTVKIGGEAPSQELREKIIIAAGNTLGTSKVEENIKVEGAASSSRFYTVKKGDTLWAIARRYYSNPNLWPKIADRNGVKNPRLLQIGKRLVIPKV